MQARDWERRVCFMREQFSYRDQGPAYPRRLLGVCERMHAKSTVGISHWSASQIPEGMPHEVDRRRAARDGATKPAGSKSLQRVQHGET